MYTLYNAMGAGLDSQKASTTSGFRQNGKEGCQCPVSCFKNQ